MERISILNCDTTAAVVLCLPIAAIYSDVTRIRTESFCAAPSDAEELLARQEISRISPSHEELLALGEQFPPPAGYFEHDEPLPF